MKLIPLSKGLFTQVDDDLFDYLNQWRWHASQGGHKYYAERKINSIKKSRTY